MLDPHRIFAAGTHAGTHAGVPRDERGPESRAESRPTPFGAAVAEARMLRALRARLRRVEIERAPDSLRQRVRAMLDLRA